MYDNPWTEIDNHKIYDTRHSNLLQMNTDANKLLWVTFNINGFNSAIPLMGTEIISIKNNYMLTFTLFCEYLLLQGKHELFNMLIPQLVSCYFVVYGILTNKDDLLYNNHKIFIDFILVNNYIISPYRHYYMNKIKLLVLGTYDQVTMSEFVKRQDYYIPVFAKLDDVVDLMDNIDLNTFNMSYYNSWTNVYDKIIKSDILNKKQNLLTEVNNILDGMEKQHITEHMIDIIQISKYSSMMSYICNKKNYESMAKSLQLTILQRIK